MRLPDDTQRHVIVGRTGSGKTQAGIWALSERPSLTAMPWIVYDFKAEKIINRIPYAQHIDLQTIPQEPGLYITHPHPDAIEAVSNQMQGIWQQENIGVFIDEGYMVCNPMSPNPWFRSLLTQGRSKNIPVIILSQRPVWLDRFVFSEADFFQVFTLNDRRDRATIGAFISDGNMDEKLPKYHSWYYDVGADDLVIMKPVPDADKIISTFETRLKPPEKVKAKRVWI
jgi:hypothetical protein